jgi:hypothetical protein
MANVYLLNLSENLVTLGNVFTSARSHLIKDEIQPSSSSFFVTKILSSPSLRVYQETAEGLLYGSYNDISTRQALDSDVPVNGPFIENYSYAGDLNLNNFVNLLLINKPPLRTGFFKFSVIGINFTGIIRQLTQYNHYDWRPNAGKYSYTLNPNTLGYAIEISKNLLYTATVNSDNTYTYKPTPLNLALRNLRGDEEITSTAASDDPNSYLQSIPGANAKISGTLPIDLFYIPPEYALRYIASYSDLIDAYGADYAKGQDHYARYGALESRIISFNPLSYLNKYPDLRRQFGYDTYSATIHYITTGYYEGRTTDNSSAVNPLLGGLTDSRTSAILTANTIIWPSGPTMLGTSGSFVYNYNGTTYFKNSILEFTSNLIYLRV